MKDFQEWAVGAVLAVLALVITYTLYGSLLSDLIAKSFGGLK